ncbi:hypothetical protein DFP72DRAFT_1060606 [Ephemerocybe angulata]|uniref:Uncharacterized protein n=1 Tax=Ephemerocybe angulata TaxID=980116 RepID=A0A8H6IDF3_9AGAR|nr:hypothetical protein DFP72DRAFT_1060606 [Tulosesus angulatus]
MEMILGPGWVRCRHVIPSWLAPSHHHVDWDLRAFLTHRTYSEVLRVLRRHASSFEGIRHGDPGVERTVTDIPGRGLSILNRRPACRNSGVVHHAITSSPGAEERNQIYSLIEGRPPLAGTNRWSPWLASARTPSARRSSMVLGRVDLIPGFLVHRDSKELEFYSNSSAVYTEASSDDNNSERVVHTQS